MADSERGAQAPLVVPERARQVLGALLAVAGGACLAAGLALIAIVAWLVYLAVADPLRLPFLPQLLELAAAGKWTMRGTLEGKVFEVELGEPLYWLLAGLVAVIALAVVAGVAKTLLATGAALLRRT